MKMFKLFKIRLNCKVLFLLIIGTIFISCNSKKRSRDFSTGLDIDKIVIKDTIFVIDTVCPPQKIISLESINDSLMFLYIKKRNENVINKIKQNKGIIFTENEIEKFKNN